MKTEHTPPRKPSALTLAYIAHRDQVRKLQANNAALLSALEKCWQATGEAIQGDCTPEKLKAANKAARTAIAKATA